MTLTLSHSAWAPCLCACVCVCVCVCVCACACVCVRAGERARVADCWKGQQAHTWPLLCECSFELSSEPEMCYLTDGCGRLSPRLNGPERDGERAVWLDGDSGLDGQRVGGGERHSIDIMHALSALSAWWSAPLCCCIWCVCVCVCRFVQSVACECGWSPFCMCCNGANA